MEFMHFSLFLQVTNMLVYHTKLQLENKKMFLKLFFLNLKENIYGPKMKIFVVCICFFLSNKIFKIKQLLTALIIPYTSVCRCCYWMLRWMLTLCHLLIENNALLHLSFIFMGKKMESIFSISKHSWSDMRTKTSNLPSILILPCLPSRH